MTVLGVQPSQRREMRVGEERGVRGQPRIREEVRGRSRPLLRGLGCPGKKEKCSNLHDSFHGGAFWSQNHSLEVWGPSPKGQPRNLHLKVSKVIKAIRKINVLKSKN